MMDTLDWVVRISAAVVVVLLAVLGFIRLNPAGGSGDLPPIWPLIFAVVGGVAALALIADWLFPIAASVYVANASADTYDVKLDDGVETCLPGKSYWGRSWRIFLPKRVAVLALGTGKIERYEIGKGSWFINASPVTVSADMENTTTKTVDFDALFTTHAEALRLNSNFGRPFRLFSQLPLDRVYSSDGDIAEIDASGPCEGVAKNWDEIMAQAKK